MPKLTEDSLKGDQNFISRILDTTPNMIYIYDIGEHLNVYANREVLDFLGYKPEQIQALGSSLMANILHPDDTLAVAQHHDRFSTINDNEVLEIKYRMKHANGQWRWLRSCDVLFSRDSQGSGKQILGTAEDITERKQAENMLLESEHLFQTIFSSSPVLMAIARTSDNKMIKVNKLFLDTMGLTPDECVGKTSEELGLLSDPQERARAFEQVKKNGNLKGFEMNLREKDGSKITVLASTELLSIGKEQCVFTSAIDITKRKQTEDALRESEEHYRNIFENAPVGIFHSTLEGKIIDANPMMAKILGYDSTKELIEATQNRSVVEVFYVDKENREVFVNKVIQTGKWQLFENRYRTKDGRIITGNLAFRTFLQPESGVRAIEGFIEDITERKQAELAQLTAERLESLGLLAGGVAHDFNNLMGGIFGYINLASEETSVTNIRAHLSKAMSTIDRARGLTGQLLTFAKGGVPIQKTTSLIPFLQDTAQFALSGSNVSSSFEIGENLWLCNIDKNMIGQVIDNIVINAQQSMPAGGTIKVSAHNISIKEKEHIPLAAANYIKISIKDSGVGIPNEILPRIFEPFFTTKTKGHGLGLATCYSIIKRHGGSIDAESQFGKGSTFHIYLPASTESVSTPTNVPSEMHKGTGTILIMDDEVVIRESVAEMLGSLGYTVVCKDNGKDAIDFFISETKADRKIAGMIFDLTIPGGIGGKEAIKEIRNLDMNIPVFVTSGYSEDPVIANPNRYGFTASISKPFTLDELSRMLDKNLKKSA